MTAVAVARPLATSFVIPLPPPPGPPHPHIRASLARQGALAQRAGRHDPHPVRILRIRVYRVTDVAAETSIIADDGYRVRAIAARFEDVGERWQATVLDIG
jgi:hypothetical protein